jgi:hypothetical protein
METSSSASSSEPLVSPDDVCELAAYASLPLPRTRASAVAAILSTWVSDANALSTKMSDCAYQTLVPATIFTHPDTGEGNPSA